MEEEAVEPASRRGGARHHHDAPGRQSQEGVVVDGVTMRPSPLADVIETVPGKRRTLWAVFRLRWWYRPGCLADREDAHPIGQRVLG
jgi:hypothetical protein